MYLPRVFQQKWSTQILSQNISRAPCQVSITFVNIYLKKTVRCRQISVNMSKIDFCENPYGGKSNWSTQTDRQTDGRTDTQNRQSFTSGVPRNFVRWEVQQIQLRTDDRENGDLGGSSPLVRGSGGSCNLVQEISFHIVKLS